MNKVILMGRLTRDPENRYSQGANSTAICSFSIAVDRSFKRDGDPDADFFDCTIFGKRAEVAEKYFRKGLKLLVTGRIQNDNYTNKEGQKVYRNRIIVEDFEFAESKNAANGGNGGSSFDSFGSGAPAPSSAGDGFMNIPDGMEEELPFS